MKRILISASVMLAIVLILIGITSKPKRNLPVKAVSDSTISYVEEKVPEAEVQLDTKTKISNVIKSISGDIDADSYTDAGEFRICADLFKEADNSYNEFSNQKLDNEEKKLLTKLRSTIISSQKRDFPKLRKAYSNYIRKQLWEYDVDVAYGGTTITFIGGYFAAHANIQSVQEIVSDILTELRFKQVNYKWMKYADEYIYYKLSSYSDGEIIGE